MKSLVQQVHPEVHRVYFKGQINSAIRYVDKWKTWNAEVLWTNLQIYFAHFFDAYDLYIDTHFPLIAKSLRFFKREQFSIACVLNVGNERRRPNLELYFLIPLSNIDSRKVYFFRNDNPNIPFERVALHSDNQCTVEGTKYEVVESWGRPLDFMFAYSPVYEFLKFNLLDRLKHFFTEMSTIKY